MGGAAQRSRPVAVVTGASAGIGHAVAVLLAESGYRVIGLSRRPYAPPSGRIERSQVGSSEPVCHIRCDVGSAEEVAAVAAQVLALHGEIDVLVNCAGIVAHGTLEETSWDTVNMLLRVNLLGTMHLCREFAAALRSTHGSIVNFSSILASRPMPGTSAYAASKGGVEAYSLALATELAPDGVRVNVVRPALVRSEIWLRSGMAEDAYTELLEQRGTEYPLGRIGEPSDVACAVAYLVSAAASWITGIILPVDGGSGLGSHSSHKS